MDPNPDPEMVPGTTLLEFADIERVAVPTISLEQHIAEKVHAFTRGYAGVGQYGGQDLIDLTVAGVSYPQAEDAAICIARCVHRPGSPSNSRSRASPSQELGSRLSRVGSRRRTSV